ncbi:OmpA family protein [Hymenobacter busanensis]|nr:OmpA family protein [Hymenobacter busanensis]QHJ09033.1 OmpA family protein [Hymenobacter busanensis]
MLFRLALLALSVLFATLGRAQQLVPRLLLDEEFHDNHRNWPTGLLGNAEYSFRPGEYVGKEIRRENRQRVALIQVPLDADRDFDIEAEYRTSWVGTLAWGAQDEENMQLFGLNPDKHVSICGWRRGKFFWGAPESTTAAVINEKGWNTLRLERRGKRVRYFINGTPVADTKFAGLWGQGIGLETNRGSTARLRHLRVWQLEPEMPAPAATPAPAAAIAPVATASTAEPADAAEALAAPLRGGQRLALRNVFFVQGQPELLGTSKPELARLAKALNNQSALRIRLEGHTDNQGPEDKNQLLSEQRAQAIKTFLVKYGVAAERLETVGYGPTRPVAPNDTEAHRRQNRRVECVVVEQ